MTTRNIFQYPSLGQNDACIGWRFVAYHLEGQGIVGHRERIPKQILLVGCEPGAAPVSCLPAKAGVRWSSREICGSTKRAGFRLAPGCQNNSDSANSPLKHHPTSQLSIHLPFESFHKATENGRDIPALQPDLDQGKPCFLRGFFEGVPQLPWGFHFNTTTTP